MASIAAPEATAEAVRRRLSGGSRDVGGAIFRFVLLCSLFLVLVVILTLLWEVARDAIPVFRDRSVSFLTSITSSLPARAGISQGLFGSLILMMFVAALSFPLGIGAGVYLDILRRDRRFD